MKMSVVFGVLADSIGLFRVQQLSATKDTAIYIATHNFPFHTNPFSIMFARVIAPKVDAFLKL